MHHFFTKGISFVIDEKGIRFSWHFWTMLPLQIDWAAIEVIRSISSPTLRTTKILAFRNKGGRTKGLVDGGQDSWLLLPVASRKGEIYIGDGHAHSLESALTTAFEQRIEEARADEIDRIALRLGQCVIRVGKNDGVPPAKIDLGRRFLWVTLAIPVVMAAGMMIAANVQESPALLKVSGFMTSDFLIPGGGVLLALAAMRYLRKEGNVAIALLLGLLLTGASSFFLCMPLAYSLPEWLGEATKERFSVVHAGEVCQEWQGIDAPELSFSLYAEPEKRHYPEVGTKREFTVHRGPLRLVSIPGKEFAALYEEGAKFASGKCPPNAARKTRQNPGT
jgi:hypothetical protein